MKRVFVLAFLAISLIVIGSERYALASDKEKKWEISALTGYKLFNAEEVDDSFSAGLRVQRRIGYPFLIGAGVKGSVMGDVVYVKGNLPITARMGLGKGFKLDALLSPGIGYASNTDTDLSKVVGVGTLGLRSGGV